MRAVVRWSVDNPVAVNLLFLLIVGAGLAAFVSMPREVMPAINLDQVRIETTYPGGTAEEVERLVTARIEEAIENVPGVGETRSLSRPGFSEVTVEVSFGEDVDTVARRIEVEVRRLRELPEEVEDDPVVQVQRAEFPVIVVNVWGAAEQGEVRIWIEQLRREILQFHGVASVIVSGLTAPQIWVECDPLALLAHDLTTTEVVAAIGAWSANVPGGSAEAGAVATVMRTLGHAGDASVVEEILIPRQTGPPLRIRDVAEVRDGHRRPRTYARFNGQPSVNLIVLKSDEGDVAELSRRIRDLVASARAGLPDGLKVDYTSDTAKYVRSRLRTIYQSGLMALAIILTILYLLLDWRVALVTALGVPTSVLGALVLMSAAGLTINLFTLFGLILVLGLVVDDAIIIGENIYRRLQDGEPLVTAAKLGAAEVAWPVTVTVLTTMAAFLPLTFLPGVFGRYLGIVPLVVAMTLAVSLFEALVILPSHVADFCRSAEVRRASRTLESVRRRYRWLLGRALEWRYAVMSGAVAATLLAVSVGATWMPILLFNSPDVAFFSVRVEAPQSAPLDETRRLVERAEKVALELPPTDVRAVSSWAGYFYRPNVETEFGSHLGQVWVELTEFDQRIRPGTEAVETLRGRLKEERWGAGGVTVVEEDGGPPSAPDIEVHLQGEDWSALRGTADRLRAYLARVRGVSDVDDDDPPGPPERRVRISPERAALYGADTRGLGLALQAALEGIRAASFRRGNDEVEIIVKLPEHERQGGGFELERLAVPARIHGRTRLVPLSEVADIEEARGRATVRRRNRQHSITVTAEVDESATTPALVQAGVDDLLAGDVGVAQGSVSPHVAGKSEELDQVFSSMLYALGVALLFIYFQLGTLFRSFVQPVAILFTVPVAIVGVVLGFLVSGRPLDMLAMVGTVALSGIVVNDSLVLVEFINARRRGGAERWEAILEAGEARFRPIILTTVTTVGGLLPLALTATGQAAVLASMAHAICWGLSLATGLTLLVIPCAYAVADDFSNYCTRWWAGR